ncbi:MAG TPA: DUF885 domain-containing protein [Anaerolineales bacterium]|nr:DUF885 domain-containing protein [Anaerolineales bacterium]
MSDTADPAALLRQLFQEEWQTHLRNDPLFATITGDTRYNDRLPEATEQSHARQADELRGFLVRLDRIPLDRLTAIDRLNADIFRRLKQDALHELEFGVYRMPLDRMGGYYSFFAELPTFTRFAARKDYEDYLARLAAFPDYNQGQMGLMREGLRLGMTQPRIALEGVLEGIERLANVEPEESVFFEPFKQFPENLSGSDRDGLQTQALRVLQGSVLPGYRSLVEFMRDTYLPGARTTTAASDLPDGARFYEHRVQMFLSMAISPRLVHETGVAEVQRIRDEMEGIRRKLGFTGDHAAFGEFLRAEPRFFAPTPDQLMKEVAFILKRMDGELPRLFRRLPRLPYGIKPVPEFVAPQTTTAYYWEGAGDGSRAGFYYVNTYDLKSRPLYELEALSLHEAVPGHHLQIALQQELTDLPEFRRFEAFTAFVEGWGLYAERLGLEVGFYTDPYSDYGRLTYEMWRACRLVVDTGMHAFGWSRRRAIEFMMENTALTELNVRNEIDRYLTMPGQALAYKMGELKIRELRRRAEQRLGDRFDVRAFHEVVLRQGGIPLDVLEAEIEAWLTQAEKT